MYARVITIEADPSKIDEGLSVFKDQALPFVKQSEGYKAAILLADRASGRTIGISFWETEKALEATEQKLREIRKDAVDVSGSSAPKVERYEVAVFEQ